VSFGLNASGQKYLTSGFSWPEDGQCWTDGKIAKMSFILPAETDLKLIVFAHSFAPPEVGTPKYVDVYFNGNKITRWGLSENNQSGFYTATIQQSLLKENQPSTLMFKFSNDQSPADLGLLSDRRSLGLALQYMTLQRVITNLNYGDVVHFGLNAGESKYLTEGFSHPEVGQRWTDGEIAVMSLILPPAESDLELNIRAHPFAPFDLGSTQYVDVLFNGEAIARWNFTDKTNPGTYRATIKQSLVKPYQASKLMFRFSKRLSPATLGISPDPRLLGLALHYMIIKPTVSSLKFGEPVHFGLKTSGHRYLTSGFSFPEKAFCWTDGKIAQISLRLPPAESDLKLNIKALRFAPPSLGAEQYVDVLFNGEQIARWNISEKNKSGIYSALIKQSLAKTGGISELEFKFSKRLSPADLGISPDSRLLGLALQEISLSEDIN
jgi:hypothetical protein